MPYGERSVPARSPVAAWSSSNGAPEPRLERGLAFRRRGLAVDLAARALGIGAEVRARADRLARFLERVAVAREEVGAGGQGGRHAGRFGDPRDAPRPLP